MISLQPVDGRRQRRAFYRIGRDVYRDLPLHRSTEDDVMRMLVEGPTAFHDHARVEPFLMREGRRLVGRLALVHDRRLPGYAQVAFFEALPGLEGVQETLRLKAASLFPDCTRMVVGLNGHLNYGAGFLANRFDEPPLFGMPYTPAYYLDYFPGLDRRPMASFRFDSEEFFSLRRQLAPTFDPGPIRIRTMDRAHFAREVDLYTYLNNACFQDHPYWADRTSAEDYELFHPFRFLLKDEHFIVAEHDGQPVGFLLWYPDFNELCRGDEELGVRHVARYRLADPIRTARLTEIAVLPAYRAHRVDLAMILRMIRSVEEAGYRHTEGGFIFEENRASIALTLRYIRRATGRTPRPHRRYVVFDGPLLPDAAEVPRPRRRRIPPAPDAGRGDVVRVDRASALGDGWDEQAASLFQRRETLALLERHNPCAQRYYELRRDGAVVAGASVYTIALDLLTYAGLPSPVKMQVVGVPCSQSSPGLLGHPGDQRALIRAVLERERGLVIGLNLEAPLDLPGVLDGRTLPAVFLRRRFDDWDHYRASLRSSYRRRLRRQAEAWAEVTSNRGPCARLDGEMYRLYLEVFRRSDARLERLNMDLLRALPAPFTLTTHRRAGRLVGWHIGARDGDSYRFFLVGLDYAHARALHTHGNVLQAVLREGIDDGAAVLDLGQTAETSKTRLGGVPEERYLFGHHRSRALREVLERARGWLEYGETVPATHVFRADR